MSPEDIATLPRSSRRRSPGTEERWHMQPQLAPEDVQTLPWRIQEQVRQARAAHAR